MKRIGIFATLLFIIGSTPAFATDGNALPLRQGTYVNPTGYFFGFGTKAANQTCVRHDMTLVC